MGRALNRIRDACHRVARRGTHGRGSFFVHERSDAVGAALSSLRRSAIQGRVSKHFGGWRSIGQHAPDALLAGLLSQTCALPMGMFPSPQTRFFESRMMQIHPRRTP